MMNIPLTFEVLLYLNSYYFGLFAVCEIGMSVVKYININHNADVQVTEAPELTHFSTDFGILTSVCAIEVFRVILARRGNLTEKKWPVFLALLLTLPSAAGVVYLLFWQSVVLRFEYIICTIQLSLEIVEIITGILCLLPFCKPPEYY